MAEFFPIPFAADQHLNPANLRVHHGLGEQVLQPGPFLQHAQSPPGRFNFIKSRFGQHVGPAVVIDLSSQGRVRPAQFIQDEFIHIPGKGIQFGGGRCCRVAGRFAIQQAVQLFGGLGQLVLSDRLAKHQHLLADSSANHHQYHQHLPAGGRDQL